MLTTGDWSPPKNNPLAERRPAIGRAAEVTLPTRLLRNGIRGAHQHHNPSPRYQNARHLSRISLAHCTFAPASYARQPEPASCQRQGGPSEGNAGLDNPRQKITASPSTPTAAVPIPRAWLTPTPGLSDRSRGLYEMVASCMAARHDDRAWAVGAASWRISRSTGPLRHCTTAAPAVPPSSPGRAAPGRPSTALLCANSRTFARRSRGMSLSPPMRARDGVIGPS